MENRFKIGDKIKSKTYEITGTITKIDDWAENGLLTQENHGSIEILVEDPGKCNDYLTKGDLEHFVLYEAENELEKI